MAGKGSVGGRKRLAADRGAAGSRPSRDVVVPLDAEDIAMARLQAHLRKTEAIRMPAGARPPALTRTTLRLPGGILQQARDRAQRDRVSLSEVVASALRRYLRSA